MNCSVRLPLRTADRDSDRRPRQRPPTATATATADRDRDSDRRPRQRPPTAPPPLRRSATLPAVSPASDGSPTTARIAGVTPDR